MYNFDTMDEQINIDKYKELLAQFIAHKSVSTDEAYVDDINETAGWLKELFETNNFDVEIIQGYDNPIVVAHYQVSDDAETCLVYGHYDVQPADKGDGWKSDPFTLAERDDRLYARGAIDNKGQVMVHMFTAFELIKAGELKYNLKFMIEGNEETGSPHLADFMKQHADVLEADFAMISDGELKGPHPTVAVGFRGGFNATLTVKTSDTDLHSGIYGGAAPSSSSILAKFISELHGENREVAIPGFYDSVDEITPETLKLNKQTPFDEESYLEISGTKTLANEQNFDYYTQTGLRPAVVVTGISSGYTGTGYRNSVPAESKAKINFRLVKSQDPDAIAEQFKEFVASRIPKDLADYELDIADPYEGIKLDPSNKYISSAIPLLEDIYGKQVVIEYSGGGLPIVTLFDELLKVDQLIVNLANEDCRMHATNENYDIKYLWHALRFSRRFLSK